MYGNQETKILYQRQSYAQFTPPASMAAPRPPPSKPLDLEITIVSAKHLKNVNWRHGDLKPYTIFWLDSNRRLATKADDSGSTCPVWNERFLVPITVSSNDAVLTLEVFHSKPLDTPKPLVGTLRFPLEDLVDSDDSTKLRTFELRRPSGRPQGKIRLKLAIRERPGQDYAMAPHPNYYYSSVPPPPPRDYRGYPTASPPYTSSAPPTPSLYTSSGPPPPAPYASSGPPPLAPYTPAPAAQSPSPVSHPYTYGSYSDPYSSYHPMYFPNMAPLPPPRPSTDRQSSYGGPSAPVDYAPYDQKPKSGNMGLGTGLAVGALAGAVAGIALEEGLKYEEEKIADRVERDMASMDDYRDYRDEY